MEVNSADISHGKSADHNDVYTAMLHSSGTTTCEYNTMCNLLYTWFYYELIVLLFFTLCVSPVVFISNMLLSYTYKTDLTTETVGMNDKYTNTNNNNNGETININKTLYTSRESHVNSIYKYLVRLYRQNRFTRVRKWGKLTFSVILTILALIICIFVIAKVWYIIFISVYYTLVLLPRKVMTMHHKIMSTAEQNTVTITLSGVSGDKNKVVSIPITVLPRYVHSMVENIVTHLSKFGVTLIGFLAGEAAIDAPISNMLPYLCWRHYTKEIGTAIIALRRRMQHTLELYASKKRDIALHEYHAKRKLHEHNISGNWSCNKSCDDIHDDHGTSINERYLQLNSKRHESTTSMFKHVRKLLKQRWIKLLIRYSDTQEDHEEFSVYNSDMNVVKKLQKDLVPVEYLTSTLCVKMSELDELYSEAKVGERFAGKIYALLGVVFAIKSLWNITITLIPSLLTTTRFNNLQQYILFGVNNNYNNNNNNKDIAVNALSNDQQYNPSNSFLGVVLSLQTSLTVLINGWLIISSVRGLLKYFFTLTRAVDDVINSNMTLTALTMLMSIYFISKMVLWRDDGGHISHYLSHMQTRHVNNINANSNSDILLKDYKTFAININNNIINNNNAIIDSSVDGSVNVLRFSLANIAFAHLPSLSYYLQLSNACYIVCSVLTAFVKHSSIREQLSSLRTT